MSSKEEDCVLSSASYLPILSYLLTSQSTEREDDVVPPLVVVVVVVVVVEVSRGRHPCGDLARAGRDGL